MEGTYRMGGKSKREEEGRRVREGKGGGKRKEPYRHFSGMTKYRKGPQRTTKDRKGALRAKLQEIDTN